MREYGGGRIWDGVISHVFFELLKVFVLLRELLLKLQQLLLLTHLNGIILTGLLTLRERIPTPQTLAISPRMYLSSHVIRTLKQHLLVELHQYLPQP